MRLSSASLLLIFALACVACLAATPAYAAAENSAQEQHEPKAAGGEQKLPNTEHQLSEASNEAAGHGEEHDEHAKYKYSGMVRRLANNLGVSPEAFYWLSVALNFVVLGFLVRLAIKRGLPNFFPPFSTIFSNRNSAIQKGIEDARRASEDAHRRLTDIEGRLARLDSEIAGIESNAESQAKDEEARLRLAVEEERKNIVRSAEQEITRAASNARRELKIYTSELAVGLAEKKIKIDPATDAEILREFVDQLETNGTSRSGTSRRNS